MSTGDEVADAGPSAEGSSAQILGTGMNCICFGGRGEESFRRTGGGCVGKSTFCRNGKFVLDRLEGGSLEIVYFKIN